MSDLTHEQLVVACKNVGVDLTCGHCAAIFFTGMGASGHEPFCQTIGNPEGKKKKKDTLCNLCGLPCTIGHEPNHVDHRAGLIDARVDGGYESTPGNGHGALDDMTAHQFSLCEFCLDWLFSQFKIPVKVWDYGTGGDAEPWRPAAERVAGDEWRKGKKEFATESERRAIARSRPIERYFSDTPTGSRDLYWCWHLNEPVIIEYRDPGKRSYCTNCSAELLDDADEHTFIAHIHKPTSGK